MQRINWHCCSGSLDGLGILLYEIHNLWCSMKFWLSRLIHFQFSFVDIFMNLTRKSNKIAIIDFALQIPSKPETSLVWSNVENNGRIINLFFRNNWRSVKLWCGKIKLSTQIAYNVVSKLCIFVFHCLIIVHFFSIKLIWWIWNHKCSKKFTVMCHKHALLTESGTDKDCMNRANDPTRHHIVLTQTVEGRTRLFSSSQWKGGQQQVYKDKKSSHALQCTVAFKFQGQKFILLAKMKQPSQAMMAVVVAVVVTDLLL